MINPYGKVFIYNRVKFFCHQKEDIVLKLSAPKKITWFIALILIVLGFASNFVAIPVVGVYSFWLLSIGGILLLIATAVKGL